MLRDVLYGAWEGVRVASFFYAALVCFAYAGERLDEKRASKFQAVMLFVPLLVLFKEYGEVESLRGATAPYLISFFAVTVTGAVFIIRAGIDLYERTKK